MHDPCILLPSSQTAVVAHFTHPHMPSIVVAGVQDGSTPGGDISTIVGVPHVPCTALRGYKGELVAVIPRPGGVAVTRVRRGVADAIQCTVGSVGAECCRASREEEDKGDDCDDGLYPHLIIDNLFSRRSVVPRALVQHRCSLWFTAALCGLPPYPGHRGGDLFDVRRKIKMVMVQKETQEEKRPPPLRLCSLL